MKIFKKIYFSFLCFFFSLFYVDANEIKNIDVEIYIDEYGNARVQEIWDVFLNMGTEGYRKYDLMDESVISNFRVVDDTGFEYESLSKWIVNASFSEKAFKSGINYINGGLELCWGISEYGDKRYLIKYDISNFVTQYTDTQGIYFNLFNLEQNVGNVNVEIYSDISFSLDNSKIWAFGNDGEIKFFNNKIVMDSGGVLRDNQYMTLLVRFENNLFNSSNISLKSFDMIYDEAMSDVVLEEEEIGNIDNLGQDEVNEFFSQIFGFVIIVFGIAFLMDKNRNKVVTNSNKRYDLYFGVDERKLPSEKDIFYFRDIPCNKDLCIGYWVCYHYDIINIDDLREGFIGSLLLKWLRENKIKIVKGNRKILNFRDNDYEVIFNDGCVFSNNIENEFFKILKSASSDGKVLRAYDFAKWCKKNYPQIEKWFYNIISYTNVELERFGLLTELVDDSSVNNINVEKKKVDVRLREEAIKLLGLKKFLLDFSLMNEKNYYEVNLWNEYLMFAKLLGIANKVKEQFSKLHPEFETVYLVDNKIVDIFAKDVVYTGNIIYKEEQHKGNQNKRKKNKHSESSSYTSNYDYSGRSRDSGGGGSSYSSGGSSARGSSGGGFR